MVKVLKKLKKLLKLYYPPYHSQHIEIWTAYWNLVDKIKGDIK